MVPALAADSLPLPRFASLRSAEVNLRTGPGVQYPIDWRFVRQALPVEIIAEFESWREIRDSQGTRGWVHQSMLSGKRTALVQGQVRVIRRRPEPDAPVIAQLEPGVIGQLMECQVEWCRIDVGGLRGWLSRSDFFGTYPQEALK